MSSPELNLTVELKLDENGRISTDPMDVVKLSQQLILKAVMQRTNNGSYIPDDMTELSMLLRDANMTALTTRKLDQEKEANTDRRALVEAYKEFERMIDNSGKQEIPRTRTRDVYDDIEPPAIEISPTELTQGEQSLNPDLYLTD